MGLPRFDGRLRAVATGTGVNDIRWSEISSSSPSPSATPRRPPRPSAPLGRRAGGLRGGRARAEKLTPEERSAIACKAAAAKWETGAVRFRRSGPETEGD